MTGISVIRLMCNFSSEKKACAQGENYSLIGTGKANGGAQGWGHASPNTCQRGSLPGESPKTQKR